MFKEVYPRWQSVKYAARALHSVTRFPIPIDWPTEHGSPTYSALRQLLRALPVTSMYVPDACVPVRLSVRKDIWQWNEKRSGETGYPVMLLIFHFYAKWCSKEWKRVCKNTLSSFFSPLPLQILLPVEFYKNMVDFMIFLCYNVYSSWYERWCTAAVKV